MLMRLSTVRLKDIEEWTVGDDHPHEEVEDVDEEEDSEGEGEGLSRNPYSES